jgi:hypothetical protein
MKAKYILGIGLVLMLSGSMVKGQSGDMPGYRDDEDRIVVNNYYDDYDYYYSSRINRFHRSYAAFNYYSPVFTDTYWYNYQPYSWGISIYGGGGFSVGYSFNYPVYGYGFYNGYDPYFGNSFSWGYNPWFYTSWYSPVIINLNFRNRWHNDHYSWHGPYDHGSWYGNDNYSRNNYYDNNYYSSMNSSSTNYTRRNSSNYDKYSSDNSSRRTSSGDFSSRTDRRSNITGRRTDNSIFDNSNNRTLQRRISDTGIRRSVSSDVQISRNSEHQSTQRRSEVTYGSGGDSSREIKSLSRSSRGSSVSPGSNSSGRSGSVSSSRSFSSSRSSSEKSSKRR